MATFSPTLEPKHPSPNDPLLPREKSDPKSYVCRSQRASKSPSSVIIVLSVLAMTGIVMLNIAFASIHMPRDPYRLRRPGQYPDIEVLKEADKKIPGPGLFFPRSIIRANQALPDQVYNSSSQVVLSDNDSMFYQWHMDASNFTSCYVAGVVPSLEERVSSNKTFTSTGSLAAIEVWSVATPPRGELESLSWNTRPQRIGLMGTIAFMPEEEMMTKLHREDGWQLSPPTPRFPCGEDKVYTIEVACSGCTLEFEQVLSFPPLAFDIMQLG